MDKLKVKCKPVIKILSSNFFAESRDKREVKVLIDLGYKVIIISPTKTSESQSDFKDCKFIHINKGDMTSKHSRISRRMLLLKYWFKVLIVLKDIEAECISCHDLEALIFGWLSIVFKRKRNRAVLVYDSHDFELGRNTSKKRGKISLWIIKVLEGFLIKKTVIGIVPCDSIADELVRLYNLEERPVVARNVPDYWKIDTEVCEVKRKEFCEALGIPSV